MQKQEALNLFGGRPTDAAIALGITRQAITNWPKHLPQSISDRVIGAAFRTGIERSKIAVTVEEARA